MKLVFGILVFQSHPFFIQGHGLDCGHLPSVGFAAQAAFLESLGMPPPRHLGCFASTRSGLTRRCVGVYSALTQTSPKSNSPAHCVSLTGYNLEVLTGAALELIVIRLKSAWS